MEDILFEQDFRDNREEKGVFHSGQNENNHQGAFQRERQAFHGACRECYRKKHCGGFSQYY